MIAETTSPRKTGATVCRPEPRIVTLGAAPRNRFRAVGPGRSGEPMMWVQRNTATCGAAWRRARSARALVDKYALEELSDAPTKLKKMIRAEVPLRRAEQSTSVVASFAALYSPRSGFRFPAKWTMLSARAII